jgi:hypothetical protein
MFEGLRTQVRPTQLRRCACKATREVVEEEANQLIDAILVDIRNTDFGAKVDKGKRQRIDDKIVKLISISTAQKPLEDPEIFSNYSVAYSSPGPDQKGAPAGGKFRGPLGRFIFRTTGLYQAILKPDLAKNLVTFLLFGVMPGSIALEGKFKKVGAKSVKVIFNRPKFTLLGQTVRRPTIPHIHFIRPKFGQFDRFQCISVSDSSLFLCVCVSSPLDRRVLWSWRRQRCMEAR